MEFLQEHLPWEPNWPLNTVFDVTVRAGSKEYKTSIFELNAWRASRFGLQAGGFRWADSLTVSHTGVSGEPDFTCTFYDCQHLAEFQFTSARYDITSSPFWVTIKEWDGSLRTLHVSRQECEKELAIPGAHGQTIVEYLRQQILEHDHVWEVPSPAALLRVLREQGFSCAQWYSVTISAAFHIREAMRQNGDTWEYPVQVRQFVNGKVWPEVF